jgi:hypothetical protein
MARIALASALVLAALGLATYVAGEVTEVAVLRTFDADGSAHATKLWIVDHDGVPWVRVANPRRQWYRRLAGNPHAELTREGATRPVLATAVQDAPVREVIDARFRAKYGLVDWWYGLLVRRDPIPVRLDPAAPAA